MRKLIFTAAAALSLHAQAQLTEGKQNIEKLCGCFDVEFKYTETFSPDKAYKYHDREHMRARELALPIEKTDTKIVIQHLLVIDDSTIIKHWREDWVYEQPFLWKYTGDKTWVKKDLTSSEYKGRWTQTIWEVDDAPRYQGVSNWVSTDGKTFWQSTTDAPLPRREYTTRNDYNVLRRGNRLVHTVQGYTHEQDNDKILKSAESEKLIAQEKGYNIYALAKENDCVLAKTWWQTQATFWSVVRREWEAVFAKQATVHLQEKVNNRRLSAYLDELFNKWAKKEMTNDVVAKETKNILQQFAQSTDKTATAKQ